jgi:hypothetical protein
MDRPTLRRHLDAGRQRLEGALAGVSDAAMLDRIDDEWTRKDVVAHLEAWERRAIELLDRLRAGDALSDRVDTDELNARWFARDRERPLADVLAGERDAYDAMLVTIAGASDEELFDGDHFAWTEGEPFANWLRANGDEHVDEHLEQLTRPAR